MARLEDLQEELERLGREIEEEIPRTRGNRSRTSAPSDETPVNIRLTIPRDVHRLQISISMEQSVDDVQ
ncbi:hypothetical protein [Burkholderia sp. SCN-KJ]|uniref:hypothetical protein n=1 Tax=Burkholderia sp. SCN-KJ TaxID=2969248 RepID=UPI00214F6DD3|nr:hypothetical protein [Burkholderia sp. SCN-KJ]MCR4467889.1 hypothetical protein [Burkholderia sp. SCN-KJ]